MTVGTTFTTAPTKLPTTAAALAHPLPDRTPRRTTAGQIPHQVGKGSLTYQSGQRLCSGRVGVVERQSGLAGRNGHSRLALRIRVAAERDIGVGVRVAPGRGLEAARRAGALTSRGMTPAANVPN
jgi:hypothetical protein